MDQGDPGNVASESNEIAPVQPGRGQSVGNPGVPKPTIEASEHGESAPAADPVELALAVALERASLAGQWSAVEVLARELEARRKARAGVVDLGQVRAKRRE